MPYLLFLLLCLLASCTETADNAQELNAQTSPSVTSPAEVATSSEPERVVPLDSLPPWPAIRSIRYVTGKFTPKDHPDMVLVPAELTDGDGSYHMHRAALESFKRMHAAAKADGVSLSIVSAFRNFTRQKAIWEAKWNGKRLLEGKDKADEVYPDPAKRALAILRYSSMPSTSRHHWGTDIDINRLNNEYFASGTGKNVYDWLTENAATYGFCQTYTPLGKERPNGYQEEKWHWSYLPIAQQLTGFAEQYLSYEHITGFAGAESASSIEVIPKYVLGINKACQ
ncbi:MAG: M15 family metallopeptidase [Bacteroidota bacterium]